MISVEADKNNTARGGEKHQPILSKDVGVHESTAVADTDFVLILLDITIEGSKINVG